MSELDILFIHPPRSFQRYWSRWQYTGLVMIPMGLFALADLCQREGFAARILDIPLEMSLDPKWDPATYLRNHPARVYAIDLHWYATSYGAIATSKQCKVINPESKVLLGGNTATIFAEEILRGHTSVDAIIRGEAEKPLLDYLQRLDNNPQQLREVPNLSYRLGTQIGSNAQVKQNPITYIAKASDLAQLNFVNLELLEHWREYLQYIQDFFPFCIMVARGCPFNCPFCSGGSDSTACFTGRQQILYRSPEAIAKDIAFLAEQNLTRAIYFGHGFYPSIRRYWLQVFQEVREHGVDIGADFDVWRLPVPRSVLESFKRTFDLSHSALHFSIHASTKDVRCRLAGVLRDPTHAHTDAQFHRFIEYCRQLRLILRLWHTIGNPFQGYSDISRTLWSLISLGIRTLARRNAIQLYIAPILPSPGSPVFRFPQKFGVKVHLRTFDDYYHIHRTRSNRFFTFDSPIPYETCRLSHAQLWLWTALAGLLAIPTYFVNLRAQYKSQKST